MKELPSFPLYIDSGFDPKGMTKEEMFEIAVSILNDLPCIYENVCRIDLHVPWIAKENVSLNVYLKFHRVRWKDYEILALMSIVHNM